MHIHHSGLSLLLLMVAAAIAGGAQAGQSVKSADGMWTLTTDTDTLAVKKEAEVLINASASGNAMGKCPDVDGVSFTMPQHGGHGGSTAPESMKMGACSYHVSGLTPTMGGDWLLHLGLKDGSKKTTAEFHLKAQ